VASYENKFVIAMCWHNMGQKIYFIPYITHVIQWLELFDVHVVMIVIVKVIGV
jgi:hypothetical protein